MYLIKKVSQISGVSVRTLHHYDKLGLLSPQKQDNGYRYYSEADLSRLQMILSYKYLGFSLKEIKDMLNKGDEEVLPHLKKQVLLMEGEKARLLTLIDTLKKTIAAQERRITMSPSEKFKGFTYENNEKYKQAAIDKYGREVIEEAIQKQKGKEEEITEGFNQIFFAFTENRENGLKAEDKANVDLAGQLHNHLCQHAFACSLEVFSQIGHGYVQNPEFKANLDQFGPGIAQYVCDAIQEYVKGK